MYLICMCKTLKSESVAHFRVMISDFFQGKADKIVQQETLQGISDISL